jgi:hypothetical protein
MNLGQEEAALLMLAVAFFVGVLLFIKHPCIRSCCLFFGWGFGTWHAPPAWCFQAPNC